MQIKTNKAEREVLHWIARGACEFTAKASYIRHIPSLRAKGLITYDEYGWLSTTDAGTNVLREAGMV